MFHFNFRILFLAAMLAGCTPILAEAPVGSSAAVVDADQVEGVWVSSSEPGEMRCCTFLQMVEPDQPDMNDEPGEDVGPAGRFHMITINIDGNRLFALHWDGRFMTHNDVMFANIALSPAANAAELVQVFDMRAYVFALVKIETEDKIRILLPDEPAFSKSIAQGLLPAGRGCIEESVCLGPLSPTHLDFLTTPECLKAHFKDEVVFRRFPFSPV